MVEKKATNSKGLTIIELMIAVVFLGIAILGIGIVLADSHRGWNAMYDRVYSDVVTDAHIARRMFDGIVRKASRNHITVDTGGTWAELLYYEDWTSTALDRYARFYTANGELYIEYGTLDPKETLRTQTVCSNVSSCVFTRAGGSVQMVLRLDNGSEAATVVSSAVAHN